MGFPADAHINIYIKQNAIVVHIDSWDLFLLLTKKKILYSDCLKNRFWISFST